MISTFVDRQRLTPFRIIKSTIAEEMKINLFFGAQIFNYLKKRYKDDLNTRVRT